jgi:hypothetical protein
MKGKVTTEERSGKTGRVKRIKKLHLARRRRKDKLVIATRATGAKRKSPTRKNTYHPRKTTARAKRQTPTREQHHSHSTNRQDDLPSGPTGRGRSRSGRKRWQEAGPLL